MRRIGDRAMTPAERQALRRLRYRTMREELERLRAALAGMVKWFGRYPEWVPNPDFHADYDAAIAEAKRLLADHSNDPGVRDEAVRMGAKG